MRRFFVVHGTVQGVGYRGFVKGIAVKNGISGFVRNHENGSVEVFAQGSEEAMAGFRKGIEINVRHGPQVFSVEEYREGEEGFRKAAQEHEGFSIEE